MHLTYFLIENTKMERVKGIKPSSQLIKLTHSSTTELFNNRYNFPVNKSLKPVRRACIRRLIVSFTTWCDSNIFLGISRTNAAAICWNRCHTGSMRLIPSLVIRTRFELKCCPAAVSPSATSTSASLASANLRIRRDSRLGLWTRNRSSRRKAT